MTIKVVYTGASPC